MKKRILAALLVMSMMFSLAACGSSDTSDSEDVGGDDAVADEGDSDEEITLTLAMIGDGTTKETLDEMLEMYYEETGIHVESVFIASSWGEYCTTLQTMIGGGETVDCAIIAIEGIAKFMELGVAEPIDDWIEENSEIAESITSQTNDDFEDIFKDEEGNTYAFPFSYNSCYMQFNTDRLADAGVSVPDADWSTEEFLALCEALTVEEDGVTQYAVAVPYGEYFCLEQWLLNNDASFMNEDWTEATINEPESVEVFQLLQDLIYEYGYAPIPEENVTATEQLMSGQVAMISAGKWTTSNFEASDFDSVAVQYLPTFSTQNHIFGVDGVFTLSCSEYLEEAKDLAAWMSQEEFTTVYLENGNVAANGEVAEELINKLDYVENYELFYQMDEGDVYTSVSAPSEFTDVSSIVLTALSDILINQADVQTTLDAAADEINELVAE